MDYFFISSGKNGNPFFLKNLARNVGNNVLNLIYDLDPRIREDDRVRNIREDDKFEKNCVLIQ